MSDILIVTHTAIAIAAIVLIIVVLRIEAVIALIVGALYLGLATGLGSLGTVEAISTGFGDVLGEVGLLIAIGVLMGRLLSSAGALEELSSKLLKMVGPKRSPYAFGATLNVGFSAIVPDVLLVIVAPLARSLGRSLGRTGIAAISAALTSAMYVSVGMMVPGVGALALAGVLQVPLGTMFLYGYGIGIPTVALTVFVLNRLLAIGFWDSDKDEEGDASAVQSEAAPVQVAPEGPGAARSDLGSRSGARVPLALSLFPLALALVLIVAAALSEAFNAGIAWIEFLGTPLIALFIGLVLIYIVTAMNRTREETSSITKSGLQQSGQILVLTGVGGALAEVIGQSGLEKMLGGLFSASSTSPYLALLLAWLVAAVLHVAIGSVLVSGVTAAGILAPVLGGIGVAPALIAVAAGAGSIFGAHVNSNVFWMFKSLLGLSVQGTFKIHTLTMSVASLIALVLSIGVSAVL